MVRLNKQKINRQAIYCIKKKKKRKTKCSGFNFVIGKIVIRSQYFIVTTDRQYITLVIGPHVNELGESIQLVLKTKNVSIKINNGFCVKY